MYHVNTLDLYLGCSGYNKNNNFVFLEIYKLENKERKWNVKQKWLEMCDWPIQICNTLVIKSDTDLS